MADGTRAQVQRRREEAEAAEEGDANPAPNPEVVLQNNQDGDNPLVIPDREEDETRDDYAVRVIIIIIIIITFIPIRLIYNGTCLVDLFTTMIGKGRSLKTVRFVCHGSGMP